LLSIKSLGVIFPAACCAWDSPSLSDFDTPLLAAGFFIMLRAKINYQNTGLAMKRDYGAANPKSIDGLNRAMIEAYGFIFHKDNKQAVQEIIARNLRLPKVEAAEDSISKRSKNSTANLIPHSMACASSSNTSPNKTPKPPGSRSRKLLTRAG
jgi:hypothetical protein